MHELNPRIAELERELELEREKRAQAALSRERWQCHWEEQSRKHAAAVAERDSARKELEQLRAQLRARIEDCKRAYVERDSVRSAYEHMREDVREEVLAIVREALELREGRPVTEAKEREAKLHAFVEANMAEKLYPDTRVQDLEAQVFRLREENEQLRKPRENSVLPLELEDGTIYRISTVGALQRPGPPPWMTLEVWRWSSVRTYRYVLEQ